MAGWTEGCPRDVKPAIAGQELVGMGLGFQKRDQALELGWVFGADVGSATLKVLGVLDAANLGVDARIAETGVDDNWAADGLAGRLQ